jgi:molybdenum cofactor cytidylyltransferase
MAEPLVAVLAAGRGSRFGGGKLDAPLAGKRLGQWVLDAVAAAGLAPGLIVVGPDAPTFAVRATGWQRLVNKEPEAGQGGSVAIAAKAASGCDLLLLLADMPLIAPDHIRRLVGGAGSTATRYPDGHLGVPACIAAEAVGQLELLSGDRGAAAVIAGLPDLTVVDADPASLLDVDDAAGLERVSAVLGSR